MINDVSVFTGVGQCGGNIGWSVEQKGGNAFYVNTAIEDLDYIDTESNKKYHIQGAKGSAKNKAIAQEIALKEGVLDGICNKLYTEYSNAKFVTFGCSAGGGTGGTIAVYCADVMKELFPEITVNMTVALPSANEDLAIQTNALACLKHIEELYGREIINNVQFLDNNKGEYKKINEYFAMNYTRFLEFDNCDHDGNLDEEEQEDIMTARGGLAIYDFAERDFLKGAINMHEESVYLEAPKLPSVTGIIVNKDVDMDDAVESVRTAVGYAPVSHKTKWDEESNLIISAGIDFETQMEIAKSMIKKQISDIASDMTKAKEQALNDAKNLIEQTSSEEELNLDGLLGNRTSTLPKHKQQATESSPQSRSRRKRSSTNLRERYRNM